MKNVSQFTQNEQNNNLNGQVQQRPIVSLARSVAHGLLSTIAAISQKIVRQQQRRREIQVLRTLDEHALKDIGLSRADVFAIANSQGRAEELNKQRQGRGIAATAVAQQQRPDLSIVDCQRATLENTKSVDCANDLKSARKIA